MEPLNATRKLRILILEDSDDDAKLIERALRAGEVEFEAQRVQTRAEFARALEQCRPHAVLADFQLPDFDGLTAIKLVKEISPDVPVIMVTGALTDEIASGLLHEGAVDYVLKDRLSRLAPAVRRAVEEAERRAAARRADEALRDSERRFRVLASVAPEGIFCADAKGEFSYVNERWCAMAGMNAERAKGKGWIMGIHLDDRPRVATAWSRCVKTGGVFEEEYRLAGSENGPVWVIGRAVAQKDDGHAIGYVGVVTDITERRRAEQAMREQLEELRRFQDVSVDRELNMEELRVGIAQLESELARLKLAKAG